MIYVFVVLFVLTMTVALALGYRVGKTRRDNEQLRAVMDCQDDLAFLVNRRFEVQQTNYRDIRKPEEGEPAVLGNVLHCKNAHDAGHCGEHEDCQKCPLRFVISKSFERGSDFKDLEACMEIYDDKNCVVDIDVQVDGRYVSLSNVGHMVVHVKQPAPGRQEERPKVLFISENVELYDRVRTALGDNVRVLSADNLHQALHRLLMVASYNFLAILIDDAFYADNNEVTKLLVENDHISVIVFTSDSQKTSDGHVHFLQENFDPKDLRLLLLRKGTA